MAVAEHAGERRAEEPERQDREDRDQRKDETVFDKSLAARTSPDLLAQPQIGHLSVHGQSLLPRLRVGQPQPPHRPNHQDWPPSPSYTRSIYGVEGRCDGRHKIGATGRRGRPPAGWGGGW